MNSEIKTKDLTEPIVLDICEIVGCDRDKVKSSQNWCYFPADSKLVPDIHYEIVSGAKKVQFHIECDAEKLEKIIKENAKGIRKKSHKRYELNEPSKNIIESINKLKGCLQESIKKYVKYLENNYNELYNVYQEALKKKNLYSNYRNFFDLLSDSGSDGHNGKLSENDHTRILLAILKSGQDNEGQNLPVLRSFTHQMGIDCNLDGIKRSDIRFNKGYIVENNRSFIDGLIYKEKEFAIIIENKIEGAGDQRKQIERYIESLNKFEEVTLDNIWVIYLTKDGTLHDTGRPTEESYNEDSQYNIDNRLLCVNYHDDILPWLRDSALPIVKYTDASVGLVTDSYIDYLEHMFQEDIASRKIAEEMKKKIFDICDITDKQTDKQYKELDRIVKELSSTTIYEDLVVVLKNYMREIVHPLYTAFENATIEYFKKKGYDIVVNNKLSSGYIQIFGKDWDRHIHYEWYPITAQSLFFGTDPLNIWIHIEGIKFKSEKKKYEKEYTCEIGTECLAEQIANKSFGTWLSEQYDKVIGTWKELNDIANRNFALPLSHFIP